MSQRKAYIIGIGSHVTAIKSLAENLGYEIKGLVYFPSELKKKLITKKKFNLPLVDLKSLKKKSLIFIAIGDQILRHRIYNLLKKKFIFPKLISDKACIAKNVKISAGSFIFPGCILNSNVHIMHNTLINTGSIIEHDVTIGMSTNISSGSIICGGVKIGNQCLLGAGSIVRDKIRIKSFATIGIGSNVVKNIPSKTTVIGNPAKKYNIE